MGPRSFDEISIFLFLTCFSDEGWKPGSGQETNDTQMSQGDQNKQKLVYNDFRNICHRESKGPKRHLGWWRRQGLTIFKNEKLLTFHLAHLYKI